jgi:hypothetical protein
MQAGAKHCIRQLHVYDRQDYNTALAVACKIRNQICIKRTATRLNVWKMQVLFLHYRFLASLFACTKLVDSSD